MNKIKTINRVMMKVTVKWLDTVFESTTRDIIINTIRIYNTAKSDKFKDLYFTDLDSNKVFPSGMKQNQSQFIWLFPRLMANLADPLQETILNEQNRTNIDEAAQIVAEMNDEFNNGASHSDTFLENKIIYLLVDIILSVRLLRNPEEKFKESHSIINMTTACYDFLISLVMYNKTTSQSIWYYSNLFNRTKWKSRPLNRIHKKMIKMIFHQLEGSLYNFHSIENLMNHTSVVQEETEIDNDDLRRLKDDKNGALKVSKHVCSKSNLDNVDNGQVNQFYHQQKQFFPHNGK